MPVIFASLDRKRTEDATRQMIERCQLPAGSHLLRGARALLAFHGAGGDISFQDCLSDDVTAAADR